MKHTAKSVLLTLLILAAHSYTANVYAATVDSTKPKTEDKTTSAKMAPKVPMAKTAPLAPGVKPYAHKRANQAKTKDEPVPQDESLPEDACRKPRNPGDPEKDERCYQRTTR